MNKIPLIIDTDLTKDDAVAIALAAECEKFDIKAITCYGEWFIETVRLRDSLGLDCPVSWGAMKPLFKQQSDMDIYGNITADLSEKTNISTKDEEYPWDKIYSEAVKADGKLEILTLGPVTNIAQTILRYPAIKPLINHIFCFAGSGYVGNAAPYSEYNAFIDPDALKIIFDSGINVTMCGLDGIKKCTLTKQEIKDIYPINEVIKSILDDYTKQKEDDILIPAAAALSGFVNLDKADKKTYYVAVETKGGISCGQTIVDRLGKYKKAANINVILNSDEMCFKNMFKFLK